MKSLVRRILHIARALCPPTVSVVIDPARLAAPNSRPPARRMVFGTSRIFVVRL